MAKDLQEGIRVMLRRAIDETSTSLTSDSGDDAGGPLSGMRGVAAGAGALAVAPLAAKGVRKLARTLAAGAVGGIAKAPGKALGGMTSKLGDAGSNIGETVTDKLDAASGPAHLVKDAFKGGLPFGGLPFAGGLPFVHGSDAEAEGPEADDDLELPGVGKGRRMPVQEGVSIGIPLETVYNQWTQFEEWPKFMHRVTRVTQEDDCTVSFATKIWGKTKRFTARIETQRPDQRIKWHVTQGITHHGVVTFHALAPRLTRVEVGLDVEPGGLLERLGSGLGHVERALRSDLHRFKAFIEMREHEKGAWRGVIENGEVVEEHETGSGGSRGAGGKSGNAGSSRGSGSRSSQNGSSAQGKSHSRSAPRRAAGHSNGRGSSSRRRGQ